MAFLGLRRGDITIPAINGEDQLGLQWHRLLFPAVGMPAAQLAPLAAVHFGPALAGNTAPAPTNHSEPMLDKPMDSDSPTSGDLDPGGLSLAPSPIDDATQPQAEETASPLDDQALFWHPPYSVPGPQPESPAVPAPTPDAAPPGGFIPKSEAVIWSGPALMMFPGDADEASGDAAAQDLADNGDAAAPDVAGTPDAVTRADLAPVLASMASGTDRAAPSGAGGDLGGAFLPPGSSDLDHLPCGLDPGFAFTPLPPPPDGI